MLPEPGKEPKEIPEPSTNPWPKVAVKLPSGYNYVSTTNTTGTYDPSSGEWIIGNLNNGATETLTITASLLGAAKGSPLHPVPADASIVHKVLAFVSAHPDADLTSNVLHQIGLYRIEIPEAINFISANLNQDDHSLRAAAVEAVSRMDKDTRAQLHGQLSQIASDPEVAQEVRQQAVRALEP